MILQLSNRSKKFERYGEHIRRSQDKLLNGNDVYKIRNLWTHKKKPVITLNGLNYYEPAAFHLPSNWKQTLDRGMTAFRCPEIQSYVIYNIEILY